jgi:hypothetical protein
VYTQAEKDAFKARLKAVGDFMDDSIHRGNTFPKKKALFTDSEQILPEEVGFYVGATIASSLTSSIFYRYRALLEKDPVV